MGEGIKRLRCFKVGKEGGREGGKEGGRDGRDGQKGRRAAPL